MMALARHVPVAVPGKIRTLLFSGREGLIVGKGSDSFVSRPETTLQLKTLIMVHTRTMSGAQHKQSDIGECLG